jgi:hypothetical protein
MKIELLQDVEHKTMYSPDLPHKYTRGTVLEVIPADNLPKESGIIFWVQQDGWEDDSYGFPIYSDVDYVLSV